MVLSHKFSAECCQWRDYEERRERELDEWREKADKNRAYLPAATSGKESCKNNFRTLTTDLGDGQGASRLDGVVPIRASCVPR